MLWRTFLGVSVLCFESIYSISDSHGARSLKW